MNRILRRTRVLTVMVLGGLLSLIPLPASAQAASSKPPPDRQAVGALTLCGQNGRQVTSGSVSATPAIWRAIDTTPAPQGFAKGGTATLYAFQLRPGVPPGDWSGEQLTASARYTDGSHPMAAATVLDESLAKYLGDYHLSPSGLVQLRIYLGAPNQPVYSALYDASYLRVSSGTWTQLNPGPDDCAAAGRAVSVETLTLPTKDFKPKSSHKPTQPAGAGTSSSHASGSTAPSAGSSPGGAGASSDSPGPTAGVGLVTASSSTSHAGRNAAIVVVLALLVGLGGAYALRRRS